MNFAQIIATGAAAVEFKRAYDAYKEYKRLLVEIPRYNRMDTVNMSGYELNKFRHPAAAAYMYSSGRWTEQEILAYGKVKEIVDIIKNHGFTDNDYDVKGNERGIAYGKKLMHKSQKEVFDYVFSMEIVPHRPKYK